MYFDSNVNFETFFRGHRLGLDSDKREAIQFSIYEQNNQQKTQQKNQFLILKEKSCA